MLPGRLEGNFGIPQQSGRFAKLWRLDTLNEKT
jgi:hypothetical protein